MISLERLARGSLRLLPSARRSRHKSVSNRKTRLRRKGARDYEEERKPLAVVPTHRNQISTLTRTAKLFGVFINGEFNGKEKRILIYFEISHYIHISKYYNILYVSQVLKIKNNFYYFHCSSLARGM